MQLQQNVQILKEVIIILKSEIYAIYQLPNIWVQIELNKQGG